MHIILHLEEFYCLLVFFIFLLVFSGFRPGCGTPDQLSIITRVLEGVWEFLQPVYMWFVDLKGAYDFVPQGILWGVFLEFGVGGLLLHTIQSLNR